LSNLLRANAVAVLEQRPTAHPMSVPRLFGSRLLRGDNVGMLKPVPLAAPLTGAPIGPESIFGEPQPAPALPPVELAAIEEAARAQGYTVGFEEGRAAGVAAAEEAMSRSVQQLAALVNAIHDSYRIYSPAVLILDTFQLPALNVKVQIKDSHQLDYLWENMTLPCHLN